MICNKKRILIIGNSGSGKSTFSRFLGEKLNLRVYHLDRYFWKPGWEKRELDEWVKLVEDLAEEKEWIIEGNYTGTLNIRALRADHIYFFDYHPAFCLYRIYKRSLFSKLKLEIRHDLAEGCKEQWPDLEFFRFVYEFNRNTRPRIISILEKINYNSKDLTIFRNRKDFKKYISLQKQNSCHLT